MRDDDNEIPDTTTRRRTTEAEVIQESRDNPDMWVLWCGGKTDWTSSSRDEAIFDLGRCVGAGLDYYGVATTGGGVYHDGECVYASPPLRSRQ